MKVTYIRIIHPDVNAEDVELRVQQFVQTMEGSATRIKCHADSWPGDNLQETTDLVDNVHAAQAKKFRDFSDFVRHFIDTPEDQLKHTGHKSIAEGLHTVAKNHVKELNKIVQGHIRKYPD